MRYGLSEETIHAILNVFKQFHQVERVVLYGSRAKGTFKAGSDIDLCIFGEVDFLLKQQIEDALDDLLLPYTIDLSVYHTIENADLKEHITRVGVTFGE